MARSGPSDAVVARWEGGWKATVTAGPFSFTVDEPEDAGGTFTGPMPTEYFLGSLASCYALALAWCARKRGFELPDLSVSAVGVLRRAELLPAAADGRDIAAGAPARAAPGAGQARLLRIEHPGTPAGHRGRPDLRRAAPDTVGRRRTATVWCR